MWSMWSVMAIAAFAGRALAGPRAGAAPQRALRGDVLVWDDAKLLVDPTDPASAIQVAMLRAPRARSVDAVFEMRVVRTRGALVEVTPVLGDGCMGAALVTSVDAPHLFVSRADLAPVLATAFVAHFPDGSGIELEPGTPVVPTRPGRALVRVEQHELELAIPASSIGHAYHAAGEYAPDLAAPGDTVYTLHGGTAISVAGATWPVAGDHETLHATTQGDHLVLQLDDHCVRLHARVAADQVHVRTAPDPKGGGSLADLLSGADLPDGDYLPAGTPLSTSRGRRVATASGEVSASRAGAVACEAARFAITPPPPAEAHAATVRLCAPVRFVKTRTPDRRRPGKDLEEQLMQQRGGR